MEENKNIDRLFQEKFKDFEAYPSDRVWNKIAARQKKKTSRKVIPLWWKLGGIAAGVAFLLGLGSILLSPAISNSPLLVNEQPNENQKSIIDNAPLDKKPQKKNNPSHLIPAIEVVNNSDKSKHQGNTTDKATIQENVSSSIKSTFLLNKNRSLESKTNKSSVEEKNAYTTASVTTDTLKNIQERSVKSNISNVDPFLSSTTTVTSINTIDNKKDLTVEAQKIKEKQNAEALVQEQNIPGTNKWNVGAIAAPVYYGDFGGSGLDKQFEDNSKSGDVNFSYGVQVSYAVSPKIKVRTGVSSLDLSYTTNEISYSTSGQGRSLQSVNYKDDVATLIISDNSSGNFIENFAPQRVGSTSSGALEQRLSYLEIPMEAVYTISEKRVGISLVGGVSTLFLNDNRVILSSKELTTNLGTSKNANELSFSTNIGLGLDYKMSDKLQINLEPSFKYQLNAFDKNAVDFNPYYLGIYTGLSYKF
ncbi:outer membrane beta-barrel protein [Dokdonia sp. Hel_I_53]|uniref:outer membrane beta-barrel protein n=1 Tax=Dokdonia sp. Hel_I_53 TaxID=1566287 RepID=UPI00119BEEDA|nr:outer membrane beta-barrel protein [Dokdonia sp. Hel_I_53]TVZ52578.1 hypothetical protein OD90_1756 [Dokdonia sp. Hel_I_53]